MILLVWLILSASIVLSGDSTALYYWAGSIVLFVVYILLPSPDERPALQKLGLVSFLDFIFGGALMKDAEIRQEYHKVMDELNAVKFWHSMNIIFFLATHAALIYAVYLAWSALLQFWFG